VQAKQVDVLLVEDDVDLRQIASAVLVQAAYDVRTAEDGVG
jgi:DNA-binding response OmpR family regulator